MSRSPTVSDAQFREFEAQVTALGYDTAKLRRVPQQWPER
jgi:apolipoprotein D and lipocalin family protein